MAALKTKPEDTPIEQLLKTINPNQKRQDCEALLQIFQEETNELPAIWGGSMIGFGTYSYKTKSGHMGEWFRVGFAPRKSNISLYMMQDVSADTGALAKLGNVKHGKGCIYIKALEEIDEPTLRAFIRKGLEITRQVEIG